MNIRAFLLAALFLISPLAMAELEYHGFTIDDSLLDSGQKANFSTLGAASVIEQLAIVESAGVPPEMLEFFKRTKIMIDPALRGNPGIFSVRNGEGRVSLQPIAFPSNRPILLHELLHAYHFHVLSLKNPAILEAFDAASRPGVHPPAFHRASFLENSKEFFALTGTVYLFGRIQQPPFTCQLFAKNDTAYLAFLEKTFGKHECN